MKTTTINQQQLEELAGLLKLPRIKNEALTLAETAQRQKLSHIDFLIQLLEMEWEEKRQRRTALRIREARFPHCKTLDSFDFSRAPHLPEALIRSLGTCEYIQNAEPVILLGEPGTGKTHLAIALGISAAQQGYKVRFVSVAELANILMEARDARILSHAVRRFAKPDLLILDELGYLPLKRADAELLFQVLTQRQEYKPIIVTTNLPFSEWINIFPDPRLCKAVVDRLTHRAHIIETGDQSARLADTLKRKNIKQADQIKNLQGGLDMTVEQAK